MGTLNLLSNPCIYEMNIKLSGDLCLSAFLNNVPVACCVTRINQLPDKRILNGDDQMMEGLASHLQFLLHFFLTLLILHSKEETFTTFKLIMNLRCG